MNPQNHLKPKLIVPIGHTNAVTSVAFSPDGRFMLSGSRDQTIKLWNLDGRELTTFSERSSSVNTVAFSPDGKKILSGSNSKRIKIWDVGSGKIIQDLEGHERAVYTAVFSPDGKRILSGSGDGTARIWHVQKGKELFALQGHEKPIRAVAYAPDGRHIALGSEDQTVSVWNSRSKNKKLVLEGHSKGIFALAYSPDGKRILTGSADKTARLWNAQNGRLIHVFEGSQKAVKAVAFSPDGQFILTGDDAYSAKIWQVGGKRIKLELECPPAAITSAVYQREGKYILLGFKNKTARLFHGKTGKKILDLRGHAQAVTDVVFSIGEQNLLSAREDRSIMIWNTVRGIEKPLKKHAQTINTVAFSPDDRFILSSSEDGTAKLWDALKDKPQTLFQHDKAVKCAVFSPDGRYIATASADGFAKIWEADTGNSAFPPARHEKAVNAIAFSPDGRYILTGSTDCQARIWKLPGMRLQSILEGHKKSVSSVAFSPDGRQAATASYDEKIIKIWNAKNGRLLLDLSGHEYGVRSLAFSPDSQRLTTGSYDESIRVWDTVSGECLLTLTGHSSVPRALSFSAGGARILSGSRDKMIKIWDGSQGNEILSFIQIEEKDWVVLAPSGLFDASPSAMELMYYVAPYRKGEETEWVVVELDQLKERYYEPGLAPKILGHRKGAIRDVSAFEQVALFPKLSARITQDQLFVRLEERNGGIGKVSLFINQKEVLEDANPARAQNFSVDLKVYQKYYLQNEENTIGLWVYNEEGWLRSELHRLTYLPDVASAKGIRRRSAIDRTEIQAADLRLYAIVVGTSFYREDSGVASLFFPDKDAEDMAGAIRLIGKALFDTKVFLLNTSKSKNSKFLASKKNIRTAFSKVAADARPQDVFLMYFSGHGATHGVGDQAQFYFLTKDLISSNLNDPAIRAQGAISTRELTDWIKEIAAGKQALILDTCHAGQFADQLSLGRYADNAINVRALDRMKDRTGMFVLAGAAADQFSYEASMFGQGLLTYSLLLGMKGAALRDEFADVDLLFQFARDKAPELAAMLHQRQEPVIAIPRGGSTFSLGKASPQIQKKIRIATPKPVLISSIFLDSQTFNDSLKISVALDEYFSIQQAKGKDAPFVFMNLKSLDVAHYVRGLYNRRQAQVELEGRVFKAEKEIGRFQTQAEIGKEQELVERIAWKVVEIIEK